jgi:tetratricopeptide (TPR) repeat protein
MGRPRRTSTPSIPRHAAAALAVLGLTLALHLPVVRHPFVDYDDNLYLTDNATVAAGLTADGVRWAFTNLESSNWHPLTWLSHMLDVELFGMDPRGHHLVSLLLHGAGAALLFLLLRAAVGRDQPALLAALLFALHPLRVESVAWAAERKDVLAGLLFTLALLAYLRHARRPSPGRYLAVLLLHLAGIMAKPTVVTLPLVLLLLDFWPLGRLRRAAPQDGTAIPLAALLTEKAPLALVSALGGAAALLAQRDAGSLMDLAVFGTEVRLANAPLATVLYLRQTLLPRGLAVFYPLSAHPPPGWQPLLAVLLLLALTVGALRLSRRQPWWLAGWLWFLVTLLPVIGLVQVGWQAMADRYTYLPSLGLAVAMARTILPGGGAGSRLRVLAAVLMLTLLAAAARRQLAFWSDNDTLFRRALAVTRDNHIAHNNLAAQELRRGNAGEAVDQIRRAVAAQRRLGLRVPGGAPEDGGDWREPYNRANALVRAGRAAEAIPLYQEAAQQAPHHPLVLNNLGVALGLAGRYPEARARFLDALAAQGDEASFLFNLGRLAALEGDRHEAARIYRQALAADPGHPQAGEALRLLGGRR